jgi:lipopolysaccharide transport system ATP-binding protein
MKLRFPYSHPQPLKGSHPAIGKPARGEGSPLGVRGAGRRQEKQRTDNRQPTMNVIEVRDLSKRYRIGLQEKRHETLAGQIGSILRAPFDNFRKLRDMSRFGDDDESIFWALKDINFDVQQGDVLGIIGHNGAGKSTLLKILSRITEPTSGEIRIKGRISALLEVGTGFHPELTGRENIYMNGTILGMTRKEIDRKLDEIVDFSGVEKYIDTPVKFYSSGMKVRLGFAVAAHLEPEILIIDEVLAVGDAEFQRKCLGKMEDVAGHGRTILFVSHNMAAVKNLCQTVLLLKHGKIMTIGSSEQVIQNYLEEGIKIEQRISFFDKKNEYINLKEIEITGATEIFTNETPIDILFTYEIFSEMDFNLSLVIYTIDEIPVFNTTTDIQFTAVGNYKATCHILPNLLNEGIYSCRILFVKDGATPLADFFDIAHFEVFESSRIGNWYGKWVGVVRPSLTWNINVISEL